MSAVIMPTLNTEVVNLFLEQFSRELPAGVHAVLIWDGAGFHTSEDVVVPSNVSLIQLPPYSPELNPVENLWHYLRRITGRTARTGITTRCRRRRSGVCVRSAKTQKRSRPSAILHISQGAHEIAGKRITPRSCRVSLGNSLISLPLQREIAEFAPDAAASAAARPVRWDDPSSVRRRPEPPAHLSRRLQPKLQQPQQAHRHPMRLAGPLDRVGRPRPALLPAQPLLQVAEPASCRNLAVNNSTICSPVNSTAEVTRVNRCL